MRRHSRKFSPTTARGTRGGSYFIGARAVAAILGRSEKTIYNYSNYDELPRARYDGKWYWHICDVILFYLIHDKRARAYVCQKLRDHVVTEHEKARDGYNRVVSELLRMQAGGQDARES